jgi:hypothetical protein
MIRSLRGFPLLDGARGRPKGDVAALARALSALSGLRHGRRPAPRRRRREPDACAAGGQGCFAADAVIELEEGRH